MSCIGRWHHVLSCLERRDARVVHCNCVGYSYICCTDAASNEVAASSLMLLEGLAPHCDVIIRDRAHGARRLASRPFAAVPELSRVSGEFFRCRGSPAQLVQRSPELRLVFRKLVAKHCMVQGVTNLRAAKHRYESWARPSGRCCILIVAIMKFAVSCLSMRREVKEHGRRFLEFANAKRWTMAALIAEATDELMLLIRTFDKEEVPIERLSFLLRNYFSRLIYLFGPQRGALRPGSYLHHVLAVLRARKFAWAIGSHVHSLGGAGPTNDELDEAFAAMRRWMLAPGSLTSQHKEGTCF